jgi:putative protein-disulfide isomerase
MHNYKTDTMDTIENLSVACDTETGFCSPNENINTEVELLHHTSKKAKPKLMYYYDALCGWCYGFSPVMSKLQAEYNDIIDIKVISGGLFLGNNAGFVNDVAPHIKLGAYKAVESKTGVKFGESFLADVFGKGEMTLNSLPPSIALCIVREQFPEKELEFAALLLKAVYFDGINPINVEEYKKCIVEIGFDFEDFSQKMQEDSYKKMAENEFQLFRNSEFSGMPALVLEKNGQQTLLSNGYVGFTELKTSIDPFLE